MASCGPPPTPSEAKEAGTLALGGLLRHVLRLALGRLGEQCFAPPLARLLRVGVGVRATARVGVSASRRPSRACSG